MKRKYHALKIMAVIYKVFAWIILVAGFGVSLFAASLATEQLGSGLPERANLFVFVGFFLPTLVGFGTFYGLSQGINLLFRIQSRMTPEEKPAPVKSVA